MVLQLMRGGTMETEEVYVINTRLFGTERGNGRHSSGQFTSVDLARWGLVSAAESHAYEAP